MPFGRVGIGCDSLSAAALWIKSQEPSLRGIFYYPPAPPKGDFKLLAGSSTELTPAEPSPNLPRARSQAILFLPLSLQSQTRNAVSLSGCLCPDSLFAAAVSSLVTQRLSAFRSYLAPAYRLCYAQRLSAESSEPSGKGFVPQPLPTVSSALTAPSRSASTRSLTLRRRPDSFDSPSLALYLDANGSASGGITVSSSNYPHPVRRLPRLSPCLLAILLLQEMSAIAATPERAKPPSPPPLTNARTLCRKSPASPARNRLPGYTIIPESLLILCHRSGG